MKRCPTCQASFPDGFQYCPHDHQALSAGEREELRFLLKDETLPTRLRRELRAAAVDFRRDPKSFLVETFRGEKSTRYRQRLFQSGLALAMIVYGMILTAVFLAGLMRHPRADRAVTWGDPKPLPYPIPLTFRQDKSREKLIEGPKGHGGLLGGSLPENRRPGGGGGGGGQEPTPANLGDPPKAFLGPQIVPPDPKPPKLDPILPVQMTVMVDQRSLPELKRPIGDLFGAQVPPSRGPGRGAGIGVGNGTGVGPGSGPGIGPGHDGNIGGGDPRIGGGITSGPGTGEDSIPLATSAFKPTILYREKAKYTEEARLHKTMGVVVLSAVFSADGRVTGIRVVRSLQDGLTEQAIEAAQKIRFRPAMRNGEPLSVRMQIEYNFAIY